MNLAIVYPYMGPGPVYWHEMPMFSRMDRMKIRIIARQHGIGYLPNPPENVEPVGASYSLPYPIPVVRPFSRILDIEKYVHDADILQTFELYTPVAMQCANVSRRWGKSLAVWVWETLPSHPGYWLLPYSAYARLTVSIADLIIAGTHRARQCLLRLGVNKNKVKVVYPGIDLRTFRPSTSRKQSSNVNILFIGALESYKGIPYLLEAFAALTRNGRGRSCTLLIAGDGRLRGLVLDYAKRYPNVKYLGRLPHERVSELYREADALCYPSMDKRFLGIVRLWEEQLGYVFLEALASGLPIISTQCGAIPEVIGGGNLVVRQGSVKDLYGALKKMVDDEAYRNEQGRINRRRAEQYYDAERQAAKLQDELARTIPR